MLITLYFMRDHITGGLLLSEIVFIILPVCVHKRVCVYAQVPTCHAEHSQRTTCRNFLSPAADWVLGYVLAQLGPFNPNWGHQGMKKWQIQGNAGMVWAEFSDGETVAPWKLGVFHRQQDTEAG